MLFKLPLIDPCCNSNHLKVAKFCITAKGDFKAVFSGRAIRLCHLNFSPGDPRCHGNEFWDKIDYNSAPAKDNCTLFSPTPYFRARTMQWCHVNFSPEDPCCHGNQTFLFKDQIGCRLTRASNAETQLLGYIAWHGTDTSFHRTYF